MHEKLSLAEREQVARLREALSERENCELSFEEAQTDWLANHAQAWRREEQARMLAMQREEILRHKWIESEKAQRDLGSEAVLDWISRYAAKWREWYSRQATGASGADRVKSS